MPVGVFFWCRGCSVLFQWCLNKTQPTTTKKHQQPSHMSPLQRSQEPFTNFPTPIFKKYGPGNCCVWNLNQLHQGTDREHHPASKNTVSTLLAEKKWSCTFKISSAKVIKSHVGHILHNRVKFNNWSNCTSMNCRRTAGKTTGILIALESCLHDSKPRIATLPTAPASS